MRRLPAGSTSTVEVPDADVARYQNLPSGSHVGCTVNPNTSGVVAGARNFSARA